MVSWSIAEHLESRLVVDALALAGERPLPAKACSTTPTGAASTPASTTNFS